MLLQTFFISIGDSQIFFTYSSSSLSSLTRLAFSITLCCSNFPIPPPLCHVSHSIHLVFCSSTGIFHIFYRLFIQLDSICPFNLSMLFYICYSSLTLSCISVYSLVFASSTSSLLSTRPCFLLSYVYFA